MKIIYYLLAVCITLVMYTSPSYSQTVKLTEVEDTIKVLEGQAADLESLSGTLKKWIDAVENQQWYMAPGIFHLFTKKDYETYVMGKVLSGSMKASEVAAFVKKGREQLKFYIKTLKDEATTIDRALKKTKDDLSYYLDERIRLKESAGGDLTGNWKINWTDPYANYQFQWQVRSSGAGYQVKHKLLSTDHTENKKLIGQSWDDISLTPTGDGKFTLRRASVDQNPANVGYFEQTATCIVSAGGQLSCQGTHKGAKLTHWIKIEGSKSK
jgi:hypothetical protein